MGIAAATIIPVNTLKHSEIHFTGSPFVLAVSSSKEI